MFRILLALSCIRIIAIAGLLFALVVVPSKAEADPEAMELSEWAAWEQIDHEAARDAFLQSCPAIERNAIDALDAWLWACRTINAGAILGEDPRISFERAFFAFRLQGEGRTTAYYVPVIEARRAKEGPFTAPLRAIPNDLVVRQSVREVGGRSVKEVSILRKRKDGSFTDYWTRAEIEAGKADIEAPILGWVRPEEKFFLQIQGSGHLVFEDGHKTRAAFGAHNGHPFRSIASTLTRDGHLPKGRTGNDHIKQWVRQSDPKTAQTVMNVNARYIFFRSEPVDHLGPKGALSAPLTDHVSIAIDPSIHRLGAMYLVEAQGATAPRPRLAVAQDVGGAIKGRLRSDLYFGIGREAGQAAQNVMHPTHWWALIPRGSKPPASDDEPPLPGHDVALVTSAP